MSKASPRVCVIGAGCSGITAVKNLIQAGVKDIVCYEKGDEIGGNWVFSDRTGHSSVCETTHIISSRDLSGYLDFPMPDHYPDYPSHSQVLEYFQSYASHFKIHDYIKFGTEVSNARLMDNDSWEITLGNGTTEIFDFLLVANGHHSKPRFPDFPGNFSGDIIHSHEYKNNRNAIFEGKRVLIIGAGNSGCDCAVEISRVAERVDISMRRGYYIVPKFFMGKPADTFNEGLLKLPRFLAGFLRKSTLRLMIGRYKSYGLEEPNYSILECHPIMNSELLYKIKHGKVNPKKDVVRLAGKSIYFADESKSEYDTIVYATGYHIHFPFFPKSFIDYSDSEQIPLYLRIFHPEYPKLAFIGLVQPQGCIWPLSDAQSKLVANHIMGRWDLPANIDKLAQKDADKISKQFLKSARHTIEVHYHEYLNSILKQIPKSAPDWANQQTEITQIQ